MLLEKILQVINAVIFDWGGVLIDVPLEGIDSYLSGYFGVSRERIGRAYREFLSYLQTGKAGERKFWKDVCSKLGVPEPDNPALWKDAFASAYRPKEGMFELVGELHEKGYKTGLLSDTEPGSAEFFRQQNYPMFDFAAFSCEEDMTKSSGKIFRVVCARNKLAPEETAFVDDREDIAGIAEKEGLHSIVFRSREQLIEEMKMLEIRAQSSSGPLQSPRSSSP